MKNKFIFTLVAMILALSLVSSVAAVDGQSQVRVVHASPDAPAVDVWVEGAPAFTDAPFTGVTPYASLDPATYNVQVVPAGATEPVVIDADLTLEANTAYTVVAVDLLADITPLVLVDNLAAPAPGNAHVRFVHASPDAPAVDIAVTGGPVLFENVAFKEVGDYLPVAAGTYDLEVRVAGTDTVALEVPGVALNDGTVYTIFAMGLADGEPALQAVAAVDATHVAVTALPASGSPFSVGMLAVTAVIALLALTGGLVLSRRIA